MAIGRSAYDEAPHYPFHPPAELAGRATRHPVVIVGAGPVGLTLACGLSRLGVDAVVIEPRDQVSFGSRATCISRRSIEILDAFGVADAVLEQGLAWTGGRSFWRDHPVLHFTMPSSAHDVHPPMVNLQQCFAEQIMVDELRQRPGADLRWQSSVVGATLQQDSVRLRIDTPAGGYDLEADYVVATDGARSLMRQIAGLKLAGNTYEGRYLIADIKLNSQSPTERRAWFDPPSNPGSTVLMHRQPHGIWRIDYQLHDDEDSDIAQQEDQVRRL